MVCKVRINVTVLISLSLSLSLSAHIFVHVCVVVFDNMQQQDAHEFLNYLLNTVADLLAGEHMTPVHVLCD